MKIATPFFVLIVIIWSTQISHSQPSSDIAEQESLLTPFENNNEVTATYFEAVDYYKQLDDSFEELRLIECGSTDAGHPLHLAVLSGDQDFDAASIREKGRLILLVNNAIHPGEPCGVDATMMLARDLLTDSELKRFLDRVVVAVIPFYNIGGGLNRGPYSRANQVGPVEHGFRGNSKNLDLNRDFIKCDSRNAGSFNKLFSEWNPDLLIDNHTSNGADYQYTMTLVATQHNKLERSLADYLNNRLLPRLYGDMENAGWEMTPYVYARNTPDEGIAAFLDLPRYSSGYAALFNTIGVMPETHMLKPFKDRVRSTYIFMKIAIQAMYEDAETLAKARKDAVESTKKKAEFALNWKLDPGERDTLLFKGYEAKYKPSKVTGKDRLYYDRNAPYEKKIPFFNTYKTTLSVRKPIAYIIPQGYDAVIERLKWNGVKMKRLATDQQIEVELYRITDYKDRNAYEGHYLHQNVKVDKEVKDWAYYKGDCVVFTNQAANRYIVETLEPHAPDSYFAWNFFDGILMQKEYFSPYVFEDYAEKFLEENLDIREELEKKKTEDEDFANSAWAQLHFVYERSPFYEPTYRLYPVGRIVSDQGLVLHD